LLQADCLGEPTHAGYQITYLGVKWLGHGNDHPFPPSTKVKDRMEPYLHRPRFHGILWGKLHGPCVDIILGNQPCKSGVETSYYGGKLHGPCVDKILGKQPCKSGVETAYYGANFMDHVWTKS